MLWRKEYALPVRETSDRPARNRHSTYLVISARYLHTVTSLYIRVSVRTYGASEKFIGGYLNYEEDRECGIRSFLLSFPTLRLLGSLNPER